MNIVVCVKQVPEVADAELEIVEEGADIEREDLVTDINEWDNYAVEEAVRIKEAYGGKVTVVGLGDEDVEDVLRRALAMGADEAVRVDEEEAHGFDSMGIARALQTALEGRSADLILTGAQSSDIGSGQVGPALAEMLGLPYATLAVRIEIEGAKARVHRELEENTTEVVELPLPALVTVQTGINQPRYVSVKGIRKVRSIEIEEVQVGEPEGGRSSIATQVLSLPETGEGAEILKGNLDEICERVERLLRERGGVA